MEATIYFEDGTRRTIHHVDDITWSSQNVYIDVLQPKTSVPHAMNRSFLSAKRFRKS